MNNEYEVLIGALVVIFIIGVCLALILKGVCEASGWKDGSYK